MGGAADLKIVLLGPPNSGKGTQGSVLSERLGVPCISTGEMLRDAVAAGSPLGMRVKSIMAQGKLVDDGTMSEVVRERLSRLGRGEGFLLDGFPRTLPQAEILAGTPAGQALDAVLLVEVPEAELVRRALSRGREDDREDVVRERLRVYHEKTEPLIGYYEALGLLRRIDGYRPVDRVTGQALSALGISGAEA